MQLRSAGIILIACILIAGVVLYVWRTGSNQKSAPATPRFSAPVQPNPSPLDGRGTARIIPAHAIPVSFPGTWQIEFTTDAAGIAPGGGIVFHISPFWGWTGPQNYDQSQPGYCTVSSSNSDISLKVTTNPKLHYVMVSTAAGSLQANDQITLTYGDTQNGRYPRARALADKYAEQNERFFIKVDGDGDGAYAAIRNNPALSITAKPAVRLLVSAPSLAAAGETITITVAPIDQLHNRAPVCSTPINLVAQPSVTDIALKNTEGGTHIFEARLSSPGIYSFSAADKNKTISGTSNPVLCSRKHPDQRIYWGDLHGHSQLSDGTGTPDDYFAYARYVSGLDVAALTDHDAWGFELLEKNPLIWEKIKQSARSHNVPHEFITFFGYEWTSWTYGHKHVLFPDQGAPLFSSSNPLYDTPIKLWAALAPHRAITISHHSGGGPIQTDWSFHNPAYEPVVEISSIHGSSECIDCPSAIYNPRRGSFVRDALQRGYRLGFVGSGDTHNGHPGMGDPFASTGGIVAFYASEKTRSALWNALQNRHVYATTGDRIIIVFSADNHQMGDVIPIEFKKKRSFSFRIIGTDKIKLLEIIKNNAVLHTWNNPGQFYSDTLEDSRDLTEPAWYYLRLEQENGQMAWSSPVWYTAKKP